jgi:hypothetical protein
VRTGVFSAAPKGLGLSDPAWGRRSPCDNGRESALGRKPANLLASRSAWVGMSHDARREV